MKLVILLLFSLISCLYSTPVSALDLSSRTNPGSATVQYFSPGKGMMVQDSLVETPEKHLKLANKSLRTGFATVFFTILTVVILGMILGLSTAFFFGMLPGVITGCRALILGAKVLKRAKGEDLISEKARRRAITGIVLGGIFGFLLFIFSIFFIWFWMVFER
jgi:hypothetical protein